MRKIVVFGILSALITLSGIFYFLFEFDANKQITKQSKFVKQEKFDEPDKFYEFHMGIRTGENEERPSYPFNYRIIEMQKAQKNASRASNKNITWKECGPGNVPGRTRSIIIDPDDSLKTTWYAGSVGGGIWKTTDAGQSWQNLTTDVPNLAISSMEMAGSNHDVIYAGTGERSFGNLDGIFGGGILKSTDRGESWQLLESTNDERFQSIGRLVVDPENENIVLACTYPESAIYRTNDGGQSWDTVYYSNQTGLVQDLVATPGNFNVLYAAVNSWGVLKSTDAGLNWQLYTSGFLNPQRIELAIANINTNILYASVQGTASGNTSDFYISVNAGESWELVEENAGNHTSWLGAQGWYDNTITVSPYDDSIVYVGGIQLWKMTVIGIDGATSDIRKTTQHLTDAYYQIDGKNANVHVDQHFLNTIKGSNDEFRLVAGNDGGIFYTTFSTNPGYANGTWTMAGMGYNTTQFYGADKYPGADLYVAGAQDNGSWISPENADTASEWNRIRGGDGFECIWHYTDPNKVIVSSQYNGFGRTIDGGQTSELAINGLIGDGPFISKLAGSKSDPDIIYAVTSYGVARTDDFAGEWSMTRVNGPWSMISSTDITMSLANPQIVWTGSYMNSTRDIFVSFDGGNNFNTVNKFTSIGRVTGLETHPINENEAFALFSVNNMPKILRTYNLGQSWEDISGYDESSQSTGFPNVAVYSLLVMPYDTNIIWAGTDIGLFESTNNGMSWAFVNSQLPAVSIWEMKIVNDEVVFATHGRGVWTASIPELAGYEPPDLPLAPSVKALNQLINENPIVEAEILLRDSYDSVQIFFNDVYHSTIPANEGVESIEQEFELESPSDNVKVYVAGYVNGKAYYSGNRSTSLIQLQAARSNYKTDFENANNNFSMNGLYIQWTPGFDGKAIHSAHNYDDNSESTIYLTIPIIVNADNDTLKYKDIAIVEPGQAGSQYGDNNFWDFVVIEATKDGKDWVALANGYDARYNSNWLSTYNSGENAGPDLFVEHHINLLNKFAANDTIIIRFRLFADAEVNGWGWVVDDLDIQSEETAVKEIEELTLQTIQIYPNPGNGIFNILSNSRDIQIDKVEVYNLNGKLVKQFDYTNSSINLSDVNEGVYFLKIFNNHKIVSKKVQLIK